MNVKQVRALLKTSGFHGLGDGLYLQTGGDGTGSWIGRISVGGKRREMGLGSVDLDSTGGGVQLAEARDQLFEAKRKARQGIDPIAERAQQRAAQRVEEAKQKTFKEYAKLCFEARSEGLDAQTVKMWHQALERHAYKVLGDLPVGDVDLELVLKVIRPIWRTKNKTARRVRHCIEWVLDYAKLHKARDGANPAAWRGNLVHEFGKRRPRSQGRASLNFEKLPDFVADLKKQSGSAARALELLVYTVLRSDEVLHGQWSEIDLVKKTWTVPPERMKGKNGHIPREHRVPLSDAAIALLRDLEKSGPLLFPSVRPARARGRDVIGERSMVRVIEKMDGDWLSDDGRKVVPHGMRASFKNWASRHRWDRDVVEAALAHETAQNDVEKAYLTDDLLELRAPLMTAWANFCQRSNVLTLPVRANG
jgi:integrase